MPGDLHLLFLDYRFSILMFLLQPCRPICCLNPCFLNGMSGVDKVVLSSWIHFWRRFCRSCFTCAQRWRQMGSFLSTCDVLSSSDCVSLSLDFSLSFWELCAWTLTWIMTSVALCGDPTRRRLFLYDFISTGVLCPNVLSFYAFPMRPSPECFV